MTTRPANLRTRLSVERLVRTPDSGGGGVDQPAAVGIFWAEGLPPTGREVYESQELQTAVDIVFTLRYTNLLRPAMIATDGDGNVYDILAQYPKDLTKRWTVLLCRQRRQLTTPGA